MSTKGKYRWWDILDELPQGWSIDKTAGSPAPNTVFITNNKSVLRGQKRALLKVEATPLKNGKVVCSNIALTNNQDANKIIDKTEVLFFPAKTVNDLARLKFQQHLLQEISFDLMVCEIEKWDKKEYINQIKTIINSINS